MSRKKILILDFGAQYAQLIARRVREAGVYCELHPWDVSNAFVRDFAPQGIILSGGPSSVTEETPPRAPDAVFQLGVPFCIFPDLCRAAVGRAVIQQCHADS